MQTMQQIIAQMQAMKNNPNPGPRPPEQPHPPVAIRSRYHGVNVEGYGCDVWKISPENGEPKRRILYLHGGGYTGRAGVPHWKLAADFVEELDAEVYMPDYPVVPEANYHDVFRCMEPLYADLCRDVPAEGFTVMGDSAGGGLALALCQTALEYGLPQPAHIILISPWIDTSQESPDLYEQAKLDPMLDPAEGLKTCGIYSAGEDPHQYRISPMYGPLEGLAPIEVYSGTLDMLNADARELGRRIAGTGTGFVLHLYTGAIHDWILMPVPESRLAFRQICATLR